MSESNSAPDYIEECAAIIAAAYSSGSRYSGDQKVKSNLYLEGFNIFHKQLRDFHLVVVF